ncbi:putative sas10 utp3 family protein [Neofusicoccum parvum UCRNP2]|uniref:Putative sas10 utp3 family protein n=1 Tax=Botryosphaeria parva (strain UCR-NP2) TaxID=1287680 RepID=R1EA63_BOTPV|nr:putative sas10 utp3 family protein [Neofusicoccum parvum UCRNP2]
MAKKRKASGQSKPGKTDAQSSKLAISTYEDVADSEDEFHINRDKILLDEGPEAKRRRKWKEQDQLLEPSDEEVLAYSEQSDDDDDEEDDYDQSTGRRRAGSDDSDSEAPAGEEEEEDDEAWGTSKKDYYDADAIETEQDALDEEKEALRLQKQHLERMSEADFGFDESEWLDADKEEEAQEADGEVVTEVLPQVQITDDMGPADRLKILKTRYPEFEPLSKEFLDLQPLHNELALAAAAAQKMQQQRASRITGQSKIFKTPAAVIKYRALAAYLAALTMYFALLTSTSSCDDNVVALSPAEMRDHPVMEGLIQCRELWTKVKGLSIANKIADSDTSNELEAIEEEPDSDVSPMDIEPRTSEGIMAPPKTKKKTKAQRAAEAAKSAAEAKRAERLRKTEEDLAALSSLTDKDALRKAAKAKKPTKSAAATFANDEDSDFGDETELTKHELDEKIRKKKSLRFYTSQIAQKVNKRGAAGKDVGGDADIPYRERLKDRQARLNAEAEKRGKKALAPEEELGGDSDEEDRRQAQQLRDEAASDDDEYYDMVAARSKQKKADKAAAAAAYAQAAREGAQVVETEEVGPDGKRKISYAIAKNKGLTPHRKKDVRNPRVKKKKKYEEKKKKLASMRQVYKGGEGRGGYKGELTGIKKGLVKSVKF